MVLGPVERLGLRLEQLEARLKPGLRSRRRARPALSVRELTRSEQDLLGYALQAEERGQMRRAQGYLDKLAQQRRNRLSLGNDKCSENGGENAARGSET
jgi:hypothetical protein